MSILKTKHGYSPRVDRAKRELLNPKNVTPVNLLIDSDLHKEFKIATTTEGVSMTDVIVEAIKTYLNK